MNKNVTNSAGADYYVADTLLNHRLNKIKENCHFIGRQYIPKLTKIKTASKSTMQEYINKAKSKLMNVIEPYVRLYATTKRSTEPDMYVDFEDRKI
jgi:HTH DNA binding domain.